MTRFRLFAFVFLALVPFALLACGDDDDDGDTANGNGSDPVDASGPPLSDEEYLAVLCTGLTGYQDAILREPTAEGIAAVIEQFIADMKEVNPPEDVLNFHRAFIRYLEGGLDDPTSLTQAQPPLPPESVRERLAEKVRDVEECRYPTFLGEPAE